MSLHRDEKVLCMCTLLQLHFARIFGAFCWCIQAGHQLATSNLDSFVFTFRLNSRFAFSPSYLFKFFLSFPQILLFELRSEYSEGFETLLRKISARSLFIQRVENGGKIKRKFFLRLASDLNVSLSDPLWSSNIERTQQCWLGRRREVVSKEEIVASPGRVLNENDDAEGSS